MQPQKTTSLESEIYKKTGISIKGIPTDGKSRSFKVGAREWFAISLGDCGAFGCLSTGELFGWNGGKCWAIPMAETPRRLNRSEIAKEREIIAIGNALQDSGAQIPEEDRDRYILALTRVIEANARQER